MSVYLYNLIFSLTGTDCAAGRFQPYNSAIANATITNQSGAWFTYQPSGTPGGLGDYYAAVTQALTVSNWINPQSDAGSLTLSPGDYLMMRVASADANVTHYQTRFTGVFARGTSTQLPTGAGDLQSPLLMSTPSAVSALPRAVVDADGSAGNTWPAALSDGSWVNWLGMVHSAAQNAANDYILNVGVSVYVNLNAPSAGNLFTLGHDPRMHVGGMVKKIAA
jgi:hypothetical protein